MRESPRTRRLRADYEAIRKLARESTIFSFDSVRDPPVLYRFVFRGLGVWKMKTGEIALRDIHEVAVELPAAYPRLIPNLSWKTPVFHPNISSSGVVCLGGYGTHWVPSLTLDELCVMLWDMIRYKNFDTESPYNKEAAVWTKTQTALSMPLDSRSLRNQVTGDVPAPVAFPVRNVQPPPVITGSVQDRSRRRNSRRRDPAPRNPDPPMVDDDAIQIVDARIESQPPSSQGRDENPDVLFID